MTQPSEWQVYSDMIEKFTCPPPSLSLASFLQLISDSTIVQSEDNGMEWNFSSTIRRGQPQDSDPLVEDGGEGGGEAMGGATGGKEEQEDTRRHTLTGPVEVESPSVRMEIEDTAFVTIGDRSSIVVGDSGGGESEGEENREGGEGGKGCVLQEPERTQGDGQEADVRQPTPPSSTLQHTILPLLAQVLFM